MSLEALEKRFTDLQDRLAALQDATNQLKELIERLANFDFQPGSVPLSAGEDDNVATELSSEINQILREQEEELELLNEEIIDIRPGRPGSESHHDKERLRDGAQRLGGALQSCRRSFRKAQISAKQNLEQARRQERELLYAAFANQRSGASTPLSANGGTVPGAGSSQATRRKPYVNKSETSKEEQMLSASSDVTQSMRRTHDLMAAELTKSDFAHNALKESTEALAQLSDNYSGLDSLLTNSRALLGTLLKSQKTDTWYLRSAFYLLVVTIGWLVWRRLLWGPTWWLVWLPLKLAFRSTVGVYRAVASRDASAMNSGTEHGNLQPGSQQVQMNNEGVPTIQVGQPPAAEKSKQEVGDGRENGSMAEQVGKIIDESIERDIPSEEQQTNETTAEPDADASVKEGVNDLREREEGEEPNPKKRMMEEEEEEERREDTQRVKDEL